MTYKLILASLDSLGKCYALPQELIGVNLNPYLLGVNSVPYRYLLYGLDD